MMIIAMLVNNVVRTYPTHWWAPKSRVIHVVDQDMATTIADFVSPDDTDERDEEEEQAQMTVQGDIATSSVLGNNPNNPNKSLTHQPTISSSSSLTFLPNTTKETSNVGIPPTANAPSSPRSVPSTHPHAQYAVYFGGDRREELKDGEKLTERHAHSDSSSPVPNKDLEHGHGHGPAHNMRHSILIGVRRPSHASTPHMEEEYRATIEQLHQRIQDLESRLAAASSGASNQIA